MESGLLIVSLLSLFLTAHGAECEPNSLWAMNPGMTWEEAWSKAHEGIMPCTFGDCTFFTDANGTLDRSGSCPDQTGTLFLRNKNIEALRDGVFNNMGACTYLYLYHNQLGQSKLPGSIFNGLTNLGYLYLDNNHLSNLPATVFDGLTNLKSLILSYNQLSNLPATIFNGLTNLESLYL